MTEKRTRWFLLPLLLLTLTLGAGPVLAAPAEPVTHKPVAQNTTRNGKIANLVGKILEQIHYNQHPYDDSISAIQLKMYMDGLDYNHLFFLQSDVDEFTSKYGKRLDDLTAEQDTTVAFDIFNRFTQRVEEVKVTVDKLIDEPMDFSVDESYTPDRSKASFPKDKAEATDLWRKRIKSELLEARLAADKPSDKDTPAKEASDKKGKDLDAGKTPDEKFAEAKERIHKRYRNLVKHVYEYEEKDILQAYLNGLTQAYDPHSDYFTPDEKEDFDINAIKLKLTGIGAELTTDDGYAKIKRLIPGGPAEACKMLRPNDRIVAVAQGEEGEPVDVVDMKLRKVVELIRGERGTTVVLTVIPATAVDSSVRQKVPIVRDEVDLNHMRASGKVYEIPDPTGTRKIGVVRLDSFYEGTTADVKKIVGAFNDMGVDGVVMDLRRNGGGLLTEAIDLTGLFVRQGPVVQIRNHDGDKTVLSDSDGGKVLYNGPLALMVGHFSASASEIIAAALQDYDRALIVGDQATHGKGTVQTLLPLNRWMGFGFGFRGDPGYLKLTVQKFYRISGGSTQDKGVTPDIQLPSVFDYMEFGERTLPNHMKWDEIAPAKHNDYAMVKRYLPELKTRSEARVNINQDFAYVYEDIDILKKKLADKSVSLNEATRRTEKDQLTAEKKARKAERAGRAEDPRLVYEITTMGIDANEPPKLLKHETAPQDDKQAAAKTGEAKDKDAQVAANDEDETGLLDPLTDETFDPQLDEALMIMLDYGDLLYNRGVLAERTPAAIKSPTEPIVPSPSTAAATTVAPAN